MQELKVHSLPEGHDQCLLFTAFTYYIFFLFGIIFMGQGNK